MALASCSRGASSAAADFRRPAADDNIAAVTQDEPTRESDPADAPKPRPRPRRALSILDWTVRVPIGVLCLGVLAIVALPIFLYMTVLYWIVQAISSAFGGRRSRRTDRADREERVA